MSIQSFTQEFQDYIFARNPIFHILPNIKDVSHTDLYSTIKHTEELLDTFRDSTDFLERESESILEEIKTIYASLNNKLDKIDNYSNAILQLNSTFEDRYTVKDIKPYNLKENISWNYSENALTLKGISTNMEIQNYRTDTNTNSKKKVFYFSLPLTTTFNSIKILKDSVNIDIVSVEYLDTNKKSLSRQSIISLDNSKEIIIDVPLDCYILIIETTMSNILWNISIVPSTFDYQNFLSVSLSKERYKYSDFFSIQSKYLLPLDCYIQIDFEFLFYDINNNLLEQKFRSINIDNNGNLVDYYRNVDKESKILYLYKDRVKEEVTDTTIIKAEDIVIYTPKHTEGISTITEDTLKLDVKHSETFECIPTIKMYSLSNTKLTPKLYSLIGISKNESN